LNTARLTICAPLPVNFFYTETIQMRILITGKNGQVGTELSRLYHSRGDVVLTGREECDLSSEQAIRDTVDRVKPTVIINAAAYTAVDQAEKEPGLCFAINAHAPQVLAQEAARLGALLIHYSTDYVFNGEKPEPYLETDPIRPINVYGESKAAGEAAIAQAATRYLVLRTSWVYGAHGKNFLRTMLRLGAERPELRVVDDQLGAPTSAAAIASATARLVEQSLSGQSLSGAQGIYHMTAAGSTSWCGFARAIFQAGVLSTQPLVQPIASSDYPTPARRPANSVLSNDKFAHAFGFRLPSWQQQLNEVLAAMHVETVMRAN
jgi:dTDP-4-dehydrorhamnose reductase